MNPIFKKLQFKGSDKILVLNSPKEFQSNLDEMSTSSKIDEQIVGKQKYDFLWFL